MSKKGEHSPYHNIAKPRQAQSIMGAAKHHRRGNKYQQYLKTKKKREVRHVIKANLDYNNINNYR